MSISVFGADFQCQGLFIPTAQTIDTWGHRIGLFRNEEYHQTQSKVDWPDLLKKQKEQANTAESILIHGGVEYTKETYTFPNDPDIGNAELLHLLISPKGEHPLNKAAKEVYARYGYRVTYNPFVLLFSGGALSTHHYLKELVLSRELLKKFNSRDPLWIHELRHLNTQAHPEIHDITFYMKDGGAFPDYYMFYGTRFSFDEVRAYQTEIAVKIFQLNGTKREILDKAQYIYEAAMHGYIMAKRSIDILGQLLAKNHAELDGREVVAEKPRNKPEEILNSDLQNMLNEARIKQVQFELTAYVITKNYLHNGTNMTPQQIKAKTEQIVSVLSTLNGKRDESSVTASDLFAEVFDKL